MKTYFDVGANDGTWGLEMLKNNPMDRCFAFEPTPELISIIKKKSIGMNNYILIEKAVSDVAGIANFNISGQADWGCSSLLDFKDQEMIKKTWPGRFDIKKTSEIIVECVTIESIINMYNITSIDHLHCDAQGMDLKVLQSFGNKINILQSGVIEAATSQYLAIYTNQISTVDVCVSWLIQNGFVIEGIGSTPPVGTICKDNKITININTNEENIWFKRI